MANKKFLLFIGILLMAIPRSNAQVPQALIDMLAQSMTQKYDVYAENSAGSIFLDCTPYAKIISGRMVTASTVSNAYYALIFKDAENRELRLRFYSNGSGFYTESGAYSNVIGW